MPSNTAEYMREYRKSKRIAKARAPEQRTQEEMLRDNIMRMEEETQEDFIRRVNPKLYKYLVKLEREGRRPF